MVIFHNQLCLQRAVSLLLILKNNSELSTDNDIL